MSKRNAFKQAVLTDDLPWMQELFSKSSRDFFVCILAGDGMDTMTPRMAKLFTAGLGEKTLTNWGFHTDSKNTILEVMMMHASVHGRLDLVDTFLDAKLPLNNPGAANVTIKMLLISKKPESERLPRIQKILSAGHDKLGDLSKLMDAAVDTGFRDAIDTLVAIGADVHHGQEQHLRACAKKGDAKTALHLIDVHKADVEVAMKTSRSLGQLKEWQFLDMLRQTLPAAEAAAQPSVQSMAAEIAELKQTVRDLTQLMREQQGPDKHLNKPRLPGPPAQGQGQP